MAREPIPEAKLVRTDAGLKPDGEGWFVLNVADAVGNGADEGAYDFAFEGSHGDFGHFGINVSVLAPGRPAAMYHAESGQEGFLVLSGECVAIVEGSERRLRRWDYLHCPPDTAHVLVGAGDEPCAVLMVGARNAGRDILYPADAAAARHGASVEEDTPDPKTAYEGWAEMEAGRFPWPPRGTGA